MIAIDPRNLMFNDVQYLITIVLIGSLAMILQCIYHRNCDLKAQKDTHLLGLAMHPELVMSGFKKSGFFFKDMLCKNCILWYKK